MYVTRGNLIREMQNIIFMMDRSDFADFSFISDFPGLTGGCPSLDIRSSMDRVKWDPGQG